MSQLTNEPPHNPNQILQQLKLYVEKSYTGLDKQAILTILANSKLSIAKNGKWGSKYGYAQAKAILSINSNNLDLVNPAIRVNISKLIDNILLTTDCGLQIIDTDFIPSVAPNPDVSDELNQILIENQHIAENLSLPNDLIEKGKMMSEIYSYIYFVENCLRIFIEKKQSESAITFPQEVLKTIAKNKANEQQSKFLPLRGNSDLFYCDFVQLQQIIINNWDSFKDHFPQKDQHWLRVKIEDMYRVRNLIAHCGYVSQVEFDMVKSNFNMILKQLNFIN